MDPLKVAARFVAFTCYLNRGPADSRSPREAGRYARGNWKRFLPYVDEKLGELLTAEPPFRNPGLRRDVARLKYAAIEKLTV